MVVLLTPPGDSTDDRFLHVSISTILRVLVPTNYVDTCTLFMCYLGRIVFEISNASHEWLTCCVMQTHRDRFVKKQLFLRMLKYNRNQSCDDDESQITHCKKKQLLHKRTWRISCPILHVKHLHIYLYCDHCPFVSKAHHALQRDLA